MVILSFDTVLIATESESTSQTEIKFESNLDAIMVTDGM